MFTLITIIVNLHSGVIHFGPNSPQAEVRIQPSKVYDEDDDGGGGYDHYYEDYKDYNGYDHSRIIRIIIVATKRMVMNLHSMQVIIEMMTFIYIYHYIIRRGEGRSR